MGSHRFVLRASCFVLRASCFVLRASCCVLRAACCVLRAACCVHHATPMPTRVEAHADASPTGSACAAGRTRCLASPRRPKKSAESTSSRPGKGRTPTGTIRPPPRTTRHARPARRDTRPAMHRTPGRRPGVPPRHSTDFTISSMTFFASPKTIIVLSM
ncbi:putative aBC transporter, substrate-binding protein, aliphatic sulfonate [Burkholderia pseudomallei MSHR7527]|nr:putative aBC transporter, substrate-binding protein, aliphatic sulfonate [Burkholderia pseudomallei MSHR7527]